MWRRLPFLVVSLLAGAGAIWMAFCIWDSYARPSFESRWNGNQYQASGREKGRWAWEEGPIAFDYRQDGTTLLESLDDAHADFVKNNNMENFEPLPEGWFSTIRIRPAADELAWQDELMHQLDQGAPRETIRNMFQAHKKPVWATRYHWIPLQWIPLAFFLLYLAALFPASRPLGKMNVLTASLSLLLAGALITLWVRSYWRDDRMEYGHRASLQSQAISANLGAIDFASCEEWGMTYVFDGWSFHSYTTRAPWIPTRSRLMGFGFGHFRYSGIDSGSAGSYLSFPIALPLLLTLLQPALLCRQLLHHRRRQKNPTACSKCGYDLRASSERCPECGTPIVLSSEAKNG